MKHHPPSERSAVTTSDAEEYGIPLLALVYPLPIKCLQYVLQHFTRSLVLEGGPQVPILDQRGAGGGVVLSVCHKDCLGEGGSTTVRTVPRIVAIVS